MPKPLLSKAELDALMDLFGPEASGAERKQPRRNKAEKDGTVSVLKSACEAEARRWSEALERLLGHPSKVTLRSIVRIAGAATAPDEVCFRLGSGGERYLLCAEALVNLVNEKSLGAGEEAPMVSHALSAIDRALFETCGAFFAPGETLLSVEHPPETARIEVRYVVEIAPLLRTTVRLVIDERDGQPL